MRRFLVALALLLAQPAQAGEQVKVNQGTAIQAAVALNGTQAARTFTAIDVSGFEVLKLDFEYTRSAGTSWKLYCEESETSQTSGFRNVVWANSSGVVQVNASAVVTPLYEMSDVSSFSGAFKFPLRISVAGFKWFRCYETVASAAAGDLQTTYATLYQ